MARKNPDLIEIDNNVKITPDNHAEFLYQLQYALLLSLKGQGRLTVIQYRYAEESLKQQHLKRINRSLEKEKHT